MSGPGAARRGWRARWLGLVLALLAGFAPARLRAQDVECDPGDLEVRTLAFAGNKAFSDAELANVIVNTASSGSRRWIRFLGTRRCLDRPELPRDVLRLILFYRNHGYYDVAVDTLLQPKGSGAIALTFRVAEGRPTVVDSLRVCGLDSVRDARSLTLGLPLRVGRPFDRNLVEATKDTLARRLRDAGYPQADVLREYSVNRESHRAEVSYQVIPGPFARFGTVAVDIEPLKPGTEPELSKSTVKRAVGIRRGSTYRESVLEDAKRNLYQSDAYRHVDVVIDTTPGAPDSVVNVRVLVAENYMHSARVGAGWGTLDCFRTQASFTDRDFLRGRGRLELNGRLSKIGTGRPLAGAATRSFCNKVTQLGQDPYGDTLNYFIGATLRQPVIFGLRTIPSLTLYSERRSEFKAFVRTTPIGGVASFDFARRRVLPPMTFAYQLERGRTTAEPALFCAVFNLCTEADRSQVQELRRLAVVSWAATRDRTNDPLEPTRGSVLRIDFRHALSREPFGAKWLNLLGSSDDGIQFNRITGDVAWYRRIGDVTLASRLRVGGVLGNRLRLTDTVNFFIPPQERMYAGGPSSVRGFRQNELGPVVYVVSSVDTIGTRAGEEIFDPVTGERIYYLRVKGDTMARGFERAVPTGGNSVILGTVELRIKSPILPQLVQWAVFEDFGQVWNRGDSLNFAIRDLKLTPGAGVRIFSPIGAIRVDVGYNPYRRPVGAAYYDAPLQGATAPLFCVSPGNTVPARWKTIQVDETHTETVLVQDAAACPGSFSPGRSQSFWRRLTFNFSIGQAF